ncbi:MAG: hypothetical protein LWX83_04240 [Anaerolineae bacterium]|nr:hypothetical protein [Anaerolineae bacterium]
MQTTLKFLSWLAAFFLFWLGVAVLVPEWQMLPFALLANALNVLDFGIHEMGHMVFGFVPIRFVGVLGGSLMQWLAPLWMLMYALYKKQPVSARLFLFWSGQSLIHSAPYIGDARSQSLQLLSPFFFTGEKIIHDWNYILGQLHLLWADQFLSGLFYLGGSVLMLTAVLLFIVPLQSVVNGVRRLLGITGVTGG